MRVGWDGMGWGEGVCEVSESHAGRSGQIRAGRQSVSQSDRVASGEW